MGVFVDVSLRCVLCPENHRTMKSTLPQPNSDAKRFRHRPDLESSFIRCYYGGRIGKSRDTHKLLCLRVLPYFLERQWSTLGHPTHRITAIVRKHGTPIGRVLFGFEHDFRYVAVSDSAAVQITKFLADRILKADVIYHYPSPDTTLYWARECDDALSLCTGLNCLNNLVMRQDP